MKRLKKLAIIVGCRFFIAMCLCMFAGVDIIYAQHAESDSITGKVHQIPDVTGSVVRIYPGRMNKDALG